ncbi:MAG: hypothetical protein GY941_08285 [Planctomycetes bacterium]|nr:hypothetical protein [Planctomycetota bacterium]
MAIEIKEIIIKTTVSDDVNLHKESNGLVSCSELESFKKQIINQCKEFIIDTLSQHRER